jgi:hypothetical protein
VGPTGIFKRLFFLRTDLIKHKFNKHDDNQWSYRLNGGVSLCQIMCCLRRARKVQWSSSAIDNNTHEVWLSSILGGNFSGIFEVKCKSYRGYFPLKAHHYQSIEDIYKQSVFYHNYIPYIKCDCEQSSLQILVLIL